MRSHTLNSQIVSTSRLIGLAATSILVAACSGGGGGSGGPNTPVNTAPTISGLTDQTIAQDSVGNSLAFTVADSESDPSTLTLSVQSSNQDVIPSDGIVLGGTTGSRTLSVTPTEQAFGSATITVTATDQQGLSATSSFGVTVTTMQLSFAAFTSSSFAKSGDDTPDTVQGITFVQDVDDPTTYDPLFP